MNPHARPQASHWHFCSEGGEVELLLSDTEPGAGASCAAEAVLRLAAAAPLLQALEAAGLADGKTWHWLPEAPARPLGQAEASGLLATGVQAPLQARLHLPWARLRALPEALTLPGLAWHAARGEQLLGRWALSAQERAALEPGALLLLDPGFRRELRACVEAPTQAEACQLVARWAQPLALEQLLGWQAAEAGPADECLLLDEARQCIARGRLLPFGLGEALRIER